MEIKKQKLVSVVIPYYNGKEFIEETILSVKNQTYKNIEIIVVDDFSPNEQDREFVKNLAKKYKFKLVNKGYNLGTSSAIAIGIENSKGDYVATLGHDDLFSHCKIEKQIKYLEENESKVCVFSSMEYIGKGDNIGKKDLSTSIKMIENIEKKDKDTFLKELFVYDISPILFIQTLLVDTKFAKQELVPIWHKSLGDVTPIKVHLCLNFHKKIGIINECLTKYRLHDTNISNNNYKMFSLMIDTITNYCPKRFQKDAIKRITPLLGLKLEKITLKKKFKSGISNLLKNKLKNKSKN